MGISQSGNSQLDLPKYGIALAALFTAACGTTPPAESAEGPLRRAPAATPAHTAKAPVAPTDLAATQPEVLAAGVCADTASSSASEGNEDGLGYLDPKVVQNVVQGGYFSMRECYEAGLARDTELSGKIQVRFVIDQTGRVSSARLDDNTLPDCEAARCMLEVYRGLEFPQPDGGRVTVVYPLTFTPG